MTFPTANKFGNRRPPVAPTAQHARPAAADEAAGDPEIPVNLALDEVADTGHADDPSADTEDVDAADVGESDAAETPDGQTTDDGAPKNAADQDAADAAPAEQEPDVAPKRRGRATNGKRKAAATPSDAVLIVVDNGAISCSDTTAVVIDLDAARAESASAHDIVDTLAQLGATSDSAIRTATITALTALVTEKALNGK